MERAIAAEEYTAADNPMQRRVDEALRRVPERHEPFVGAASRQRPLRRAVRVRVPRRLPRPLTAEDVDALLTSTSSRRDLAIRPLMLDGGLRPGEVLCLRVEDVAYGRRRVTIRKLDDHPRGARAKARRERVVDLHEPRTLDAVSRYVLHERPLDSDSPSVCLVGGSGPRRREPYSYQGLARSFARRLDRLGIQTRRRPRTRCVTPTPQRCGRAGCASLRCSRLGHASPESIRIYTRVSDEQVLSEYRLRCKDAHDRGNRCRDSRRRLAGRPVAACVPRLLSGMGVASRREQFSAVEPDGRLTTASPRRWPCLRRLARLVDVMCRHFQAL